VFLGVATILMSSISTFTGIDLSPFHGTFNLNVPIVPSCILIGRLNLSNASGLIFRFVRCTFPFHTSISNCFDDNGFVMYDPSRVFSNEVSNDSNIVLCNYSTLQWGEVSLETAKSDDENQKGHEGA